MGDMYRHLGSAGLIQYPVFVNSIPKAGTNLAKNIVMAVPGTYYLGSFNRTLELETPPEQLDDLKGKIFSLLPGRVYSGHIPYSREVASWFSKHAFRQIFVYRDPRDYAVSVYRFIMKDKQPRHPFYEMYANLGSDSERLMAVIRGLGEGVTHFKVSPSSIPNVKLMYEAMLGWMSVPGVLAVRYEDLIYADHNDMESCINTVQNILQFLDVTCDKEYAKAIYLKGSDPKKSHTFRQGREGGWREEYTEKHIEVFRQVSGDLLDRLGYQW
jgi:hypothetical protein